jgi:hypothetical protein
MLVTENRPVVARLSAEKPVALFPSCNLPCKNLEKLILEITDPIPPTPIKNGEKTFCIAYELTNMALPTSEFTKIIFIGWIFLSFE